MPVTAQSYFRCIPIRFSTFFWRAAHCKLSAMVLEISFPVALQVEPKATIVDRVVPQHELLMVVELTWLLSFPFVWLFDMNLIQKAFQTLTCVIMTRILPKTSFPCGCQIQWARSSQKSAQSMSWALVIHVTVSYTHLRAHET